MQDDDIHLLSFSDLSDVTFLVGPKAVPIRAHRIILCRSEYFARCFKLGWSDATAATAATINKPDDNVDAFRIILEYIYTREIPSNFNQDLTALSALLEMTERYQLAKFHHRCSDEIFQRLEDNEDTEHYVRLWESISTPDDSPFASRLVDAMLPWIHGIITHFSENGLRRLIQHDCLWLDEPEIMELVDEWVVDQQREHQMSDQAKDEFYKTILPFIRLENTDMEGLRRIKLQCPWFPKDVIEKRCVSLVLDPQSPYAVRYYQRYPYTVIDNKSDILTEPIARQMINLLLSEEHENDNVSRLQMQYRMRSRDLLERDFWTACGHEETPTLLVVKTGGGDIVAVRNPHPWCRQGPVKCANCAESSNTMNNTNKECAIFSHWVLQLKNGEAVTKSSYFAGPRIFSSSAEKIICRVSPLRQSAHCNMWETQEPFVNIEVGQQRINIQRESTCDQVVALECFQIVTSKTQWGS